MGVLAVAIVIVGFIVCSRGLQKGLERVSKVMMIALLALIVILAGHSLTLSGAAEGMKFYLLPSLDSIRENGLRSLITDAMNQAFFTLSLGIAAMEIFGSYMSDDHTLAGESIRICALDTFVALMAGVDHLPRMLFLRRSARQWPVPPLRHAAAGVRQHGGRPLLGHALLPLHDVCEHVHGAGGV